MTLLTTLQNNLNASGLTVSGSIVTVNPIITSTVDINENISGSIVTANPTITANISVIPNIDVSASITTIKPTITSTVNIGITANGVLTTIQPTIIGSVNVNQSISASITTVQPTITANITPAGSTITITAGITTVNPSIAVAIINGEVSTPAGKRKKLRYLKDGRKLKLSDAEYTQYLNIEKERAERIAAESVATVIEPEETVEITLTVPEVIEQYNPFDGFIFEVSQEDFNKALDAELYAQLQLLNSRFEEQEEDDIAALMCLMDF